MKNQGTQSVRFQSIPDTLGIHMVWGDRVKNRFPRHTHRVFCIGIVDQGTRVIEERRATTMIPEGHLFVVNPGESHACGPLDEQGHSYRVMCVEAEFLQSLASRLSGKKEGVPHFRETHVVDNQLVRLMNQSFSAFERGAPLRRQESGLHALYARLIMIHAADAPWPREADDPLESVDRVRAYIEAHFSENLSLEELARIACLSPYHFQRVFVGSMGVSPREYLIQFRLRKAGELLRSGLGIAETALETGFVDQSHFTRLFKRAVGIPPGQYLRLHRLEDASA